MENSRNRVLLLLSTVLAALLVLLPVTIGQEYAYTDVYFNVPSDVSFQLTLPGMPTNDSDTSSPGTQTAWISFNGSVCGGQQIPYVEGITSNTQSDDPIQPIFSFDNVGNTDIKVWSKFNTSLPAGIIVWWNSSGCDDACGNYKGAANTTNPEMNESEWTQFAEDFGTGDAALNVSLYSNYSCNVTAGETIVGLYHKGNTTGQA